MRRIAVINQKGGVGKTTTSVNLGAALAQQGRRVVLVDMDAQANLSLSLGIEVPSDAASTYTVLIGESTFEQALRPAATDNLLVMPSNIDLSGAELELASAIAREYLMRDALRTWETEHTARTGSAPADYVIFDCPPSLGLLSINALAAAGEVLITLQTEFLALQGMSKLVEVMQLLRKRLNPELVITGILPCLYDSRLKLAREVLGEIRKYFPGQVFPNPVRSNVKLAEAPSHGKTIFEYAPDSNGAQDYRLVAREVIGQEMRDRELSGLPPYTEPEVAAHEPSEERAQGRFVRASSKTKEPLASEIPALDAQHRETVRRTTAETQPMHDASADDGDQLADDDLADVVLIPMPATDPAIANASAANGQPAPVDAGADRSSIPTSNGTIADAPIALTPAEALVARAGTEASAPCAVPAHATVEIAHAVDDITRMSPPSDSSAVEVPSLVVAHSRKDLAPASTPRRILRAEDLPPLPPDAFEILTSYIREG